MIRIEIPGAELKPMLEQAGFGAAASTINVDKRYMVIPLP